MSLAGYKAVEVRSDERGLVDVDALLEGARRRCRRPDADEPEHARARSSGTSRRSQAAVHEVGGLLYYDGANFNSIVGVVRPGDMGFDIVHLNLHKTFATPHGGGGPGSGPLAVSRAPGALPPGAGPHLGRGEPRGGAGTTTGRTRSAGSIRFHGNFGINVRAYAYLRSLGPEGLRRVAERAVLNANYLRVLVEDAFPSAYPGIVHARVRRHRQAAQEARRPRRWTSRSVSSTSATTLRPCTSRSWSRRP